MIQSLCYLVIFFAVYLPSALHRFRLSVTNFKCLHIKKLYKYLICWEYSLSAIYILLLFFSSFFFRSLNYMLVICQCEKFSLLFLFRRFFCHCSGNNTKFKRKWGNSCWSSWKFPRFTVGNCIVSSSQLRWWTIEKWR